MPTTPELDYYLDNSDRIKRPDENAQLTYLHRVTTWPAPRTQLFIHAFDHRRQLIQMAEESGADLNRINVLKELLFEATSNVINQRGMQSSGGILCDDSFGQNVLNKATGSDLWIGRPVEEPGSVPIEFEGNASIGSRLKSWPTEQIVKCLVFYSAADEINLRQRQDDSIVELYQSCCESGHQLMLELIPPTPDIEPGGELGSIDTGESLYRSIDHLLKLNVKPDWWKIPCVESAWAAKICALIQDKTPHCCGVVVLGLDAPVSVLAKGFEAFRGLPLVKGFAVGRTIFSSAARHWLAGEYDDATLVAEVEKNYSATIDLWCRATGIKQQA